MQRRLFLKSAGLASGILLAKPLFGSIGIQSQSSFPMMDLHVHSSRTLAIEDIAKLSEQTGIKFGVMQNIASYGINDDASLKSFIDSVKQYPLYVGLQPMSPGWSKNLSKELIAQADYVTMDPQTIPNGNKYGDTISVWEHDAYIPDTEEFMKRNLEHYMTVLTNDEPLDIFGWPLFLPPSLGRDYYTLWTKERMTQIIDTAKQRGVAIEINDLAHTPHKEFIQMAKEAGLKFAFGSDTRNEKTGRLDYCKSIAKECNLKYDDFFIPKRVI